MLSILLATIAQESLLRDYVLTNDKAYVMLAPEVVCGPRASELLWSANGQYLAAVCRTDGGTREQVEAVAAGRAATPLVQNRIITVWNRETHLARTAYKGDAASLEMRSLQWLGNSGDLVARVYAPDRERETTEAWILGAGGIKTLYKGARNQEVEIQGSPTQPIGSLLIAHRGDPAWKTEIHLFDRQGKLDAPVPVNLDTRMVVWPDGSATPLIYASTPKSPDGEWLRVSPATGTTPATEPAMPQPPKLPLKVEFAAVKVVLSQDDSVNTVAAKISQASINADAAMLTGDGGMAAISPDCRHIAYTVQGAVFVRELVPVSKAAFVAARDALAIRELTDRAKAISVALMNFRDDNDGDLPGNAGWEQTLRPYMKDPSLFQGFNYTFPGGSLGKADAGKASVGFFTGPGGRATLFADGSVRWEKG